MCKIITYFVFQYNILFNVICYTGTNLNYIVIFHLLSAVMWENVILGIQFNRISKKTKWIGNRRHRRYVIEFSSFFVRSVDKRSILYSTTVFVGSDDECRSNGFRYALDYYSFLFYL